jgi:catechol 2,3-dioxygenase-like lactoylglutathione lyase family enzyme
VKLDRATVCLPIKNRQASHAFYTALGFMTVGEMGDDGLTEPLQFETSAGLRVLPHSIAAQTSLSLAGLVDRSNRVVTS